MAVKVAMLEPQIEREQDTVADLPAVSRAYRRSGAAYSNRTLATRNVTVLLSALGGVRPLAWRLPAYRQI